MAAPPTAVPMEAAPTSSWNWCGRAHHRVLRRRQARHPRARSSCSSPVCQAIQHAHQKGIIHRDIKPTNVLVTLHDGVPVPKVIDFGIAKATAQPLTDKTVYTAFHAMIGTPAYMSLEQAEMSGLDIDTRSDIYSLGVLAYELLTGSTPFDSARLYKAGLMEIQRIIREEEPPKPSLRFSTMGDALTTVAGHRSVEPSRLSKLVAGELDWIVMRALEKDRKRRYETATDLAADFKRHLAGEPVVAAPPTWGYRARKFVRKHRGKVAAGIAVAAALILGVIGTTMMGMEARRQATLARLSTTREAARADGEAHARDKSESESYVANIASAQFAMAGNDWPEARSRLDACPESKRGWEWKFLRKQAGSVLWSLPTGTESFELSKDGKRLLTSSYNGDERRLWDAGSGKPIGPPIDCNDHMMNHNESVASPDRTRLVLLSQSNAIVNTETGDIFGNLVSSPYLARVAFSPDGLKIVARQETSKDSPDFTVTLWDVGTGRLIGTPTQCKRGRDERKHLSEVFSPDSTRLLVAPSENVLQILDTRSGMVIGPAMHHTGSIQSAAFSPDGARIVTFDHVHVGEPTDKSSMFTVDSGIWEVITGKKIAGPFPELWPIFTQEEQLSFSTDGKRLLAASWGRAQIWDVESAKPTCAEMNHSDHIDSVSFSRDCSLVVTSGWDDSARLWDSTTGKPRCDPLPHFALKLASFTPDGKCVLTIGWSKGGSAIFLWNADGNRIGGVQTIKRMAHAGVPAAGPDGKTIYVKVDDAVRAFDRSNFDTSVDSFEIEELGSMESLTAICGYSSLKETKVKADTRVLKAAIADDGYIDVSSDNVYVKINRIGSPANHIRAFTLSPDNTRLVTGDDSTIRFYDTATWREVAVFRQETAVKDLKFTPDGTRLIVRFGDGSAQIWDPRPLAERQKMWARRAAERKPAREYLDKLLAGPMMMAKGAADRKQAVRDDATITPLRKLVALELLDLEIHKRERQAATRPTTGPATAPAK